MKHISARFFRDFCFVVMAGYLSCANAAVDNTGCSNDDNAYVSPELALCSTHAYNIGAVENPESDAQKQVMKDVVALKTTIMTQQMYKQYEYLESMIKRFKTQLEKAVLTTKLEAAGAANESSSYSSGLNFSSNDRNIYIAGVSNCNNELTPLKVFECLNSNLNSLYNSSNNGTNITIELRKQLANDYAVAANECGKDCTIVDKCKNAQNLAKRTDFQECLDGLRGIIRKGYSDASSRQTKQSGMQFQGGFGNQYHLFNLIQF